MSDREILLQFLSYIWVHNDHGTLKNYFLIITHNLPNVPKLHSRNNSKWEKEKKKTAFDAPCIFYIWVYKNTIIVWLPKKLFVVLHCLVPMARRLYNHQQILRRLFSLSMETNLQGQLEFLANSPNTTGHRRTWYVLPMLS